MTDAAKMQNKLFFQIKNNHTRGLQNKNLKTQYENESGNMRWILNLIHQPVIEDPPTIWI